MRLLRRTVVGWLLPAALTVAVAGLASKPADGAQGKVAEPVDPDKAFKVAARRAGPNRVVVDFSVLPAYYLYEDRTSIALQSSPGVRIKKVVFPKPRMKDDMSFGRVAVYPASFAVEVELEGAEKSAATFLVQYQGCYETMGVCYPPQTATLKVEQ